MIELQITAASRVGCVRSKNEDMILVGDNFVRNDKMKMEANLNKCDRFMVALADGMGGHKGGEVASSDTLHNLQFFFSDIPATMSPGSFNEAIYEWLQSINNTIDAKGRADADLLGMGTTLVALAYYGGEFYWMNCGDSRLYQLRNGVLSQLTTDHSLSNLLGETQHSNVITNCIGGGCKTSFIDLKCCTTEVQNSDLLLLCSDGLTDMVTDSQLRQFLLEGYDAEALCHAAEAEGGYDNVSVILIKPVNYAS